MLVEVSGGIFSTKFLVSNHGPERLPMPKNVAEGHQTPLLHSGNELTLKCDIYLSLLG